MDTIGRASINKPTLAGSASRNMPRRAEASEERISSCLPSACCAEKVGIAAIATDWAMAACAMSISMNPYDRLTRLPSAMREPRLVLTQKFNCTIAAPNTRGPINWITLCRSELPHPSERENSPLSLNRDGNWTRRNNAEPITTPQARP